MNPSVQYRVSVFQKVQLAQEIFNFLINVCSLISSFIMSIPNFPPTLEFLPLRFQCTHHFNLRSQFWTFRLDLNMPHKALKLGSIQSKPGQKILNKNNKGQWGRKVGWRLELHLMTKVMWQIALEDNLKVWYTRLPTVQSFKWPERTQDV